MAQAIRRKSMSAVHRRRKTNKKIRANVLNLLLGLGAIAVFTYSGVLLAVVTTMFDPSLAPSGH